MFVMIFILLLMNSPIKKKKISRQLSLVLVGSHVPVLVCHSFGVSPGVISLMLVLLFLHLLILRLAYEMLLIDLNNCLIFSVYLNCLL